MAALPWAGGAEERETIHVSPAYCITTEVFLQLLCLPVSLVLILPAAAVNLQGHAYCNDNAGISCPPAWLLMLLFVSLSLTAQLGTSAHHKVLQRADIRFDLSYQHGYISLHRTLCLAVILIGSLSPDSSSTASSIAMVAATGINLLWQILHWRSMCAIPWVGTLRVAAAFAVCFTAVLRCWAESGSPSLLPGWTDHVRYQGGGLLLAAFLLSLAQWYQARKQRWIELLEAQRASSSF